MVAITPKPEAGFVIKLWLIFVEIRKHVIIARLCKNLIVIAILLSTVTYFANRNRNATSDRQRLNIAVPVITVIT